MNDERPRWLEWLLTHESVMAGRGFCVGVNFALACRAEGTAAALYAAACVVWTVALCLSVAAARKDRSRER